MAVTNPARLLEECIPYLKYEIPNKGTELNSIFEFAFKRALHALIEDAEASNYEPSDGNEDAFEYLENTLVSIKQDEDNDDDDDDKDDDKEEIVEDPDIEDDDKDEDDKDETEGEEKASVSDEDDDEDWLEQSREEPKSEPTNQ